MACLLPFACAGTYNNDEFTYMSHALRVLHGEVLYRDFFEFVAPMHIWLLAGAYAIAGPTMLTTHAAAALAIGVAGWQLNRLARAQELGPVLAWLPAFGLLFGLFSRWNAFSHHWIVLPFELAALLAAFRGLASTSWRPWLVAGCATGLAGLTLQTDGIAFAGALGLGLAFDGWRRQLDPSLVIRRSFALILGITLPLGLAALVLLLQGTLGTALYDMLIWPTQQYRQGGGVNDVPYGTDLPHSLLPIGVLPGWYGRAYHVVFLVVLPPLAALGAFAWLVDRGRRSVHWGMLESQVTLVAFWALAAFAIATRGRADLVHAAQYAVPALLLSCVAASRLACKPTGRAMRSLPLAALVAFIGTGALMQAKAMAAEPFRWNRPLAPDAYLREIPVIQYLKSHARPGDRLVAAPYGGYFYFYGLPPATRYALMLPPEAGYGAPGEFEAFWAEVARNRPRFILLQPLPWLDDRIWQPRYVQSLPPRYHAVGTFTTPQFNFGWPATLYEADEAPGQDPPATPKPHP